MTDPLNRIGMASPTGVRDDWYGMYRGVVVDWADPQARSRYRVRVAGVHPPEVPVANLPWAELVLGFSAKLAADLPHYEVGDLVWVQFENGDRRLPCIVGGWVSRSSSLNDTPTEVATEYAANRYRWVRVDRVGNKIEQSEVSSELWTRLMSGACEVVLSQATGNVSVRAPSGVVTIAGQSVEADAKMFVTTAGQVVIQAHDLDALGGGTGVMELLANLNIDIHANGTLTIGGYLPTFAGEPSPSTPGMGFQQTPHLAVRAREVELGTATGEVSEGASLPETDGLTLNGVTISLQAHAATNLPPISNVPQITISSDGTISIVSTSKVQIQAPEIDLI